MNLKTISPRKARKKNIEFLNFVSFVDKLLLPK